MAEMLTMPKVGMLEEDITLVRWLIAEGDVIKEGEFVAEIESEKSTTELESFVEGTILRILVHEGESVPIGTALAIVGMADEDITGVPG